MNIYDEAIELLNNTKTAVQVEDDSWMGVSQYEINCVIDDTVYEALERAKKVEELLMIYKQYYNGYLSPADQKRRQDLEKELRDMK